MDFTIGCVNYFLILYADICVYRTWRNFYGSKSSFFVSLHSVRFFEAWLLSVLANELFHCRLKCSFTCRSQQEQQLRLWMHRCSSSAMKRPARWINVKRLNVRHPQSPGDGPHANRTVNGLLWGRRGKDGRVVGGVGLFARNKAFPEESCLKLPRQMRRSAARHERNGLVSATFISLPGGDLLLRCCFCCSYLPRRA